MRRFLRRKGLLQSSNKKESCIRGTQFSFSVCDVTKNIVEEENNNSPSLKPEWALDVEIGSLAAKVRGDVLSTLTSEQRQDYDNDNERGAEVVKTMRETFILKARSEYGTLISPALLDAKIEGFADAL